MGWALDGHVLCAVGARERRGRAGREDQDIAALSSLPSAITLSCRARARRRRHGIIDRDRGGSALAAVPAEVSSVNCAVALGKVGAEDVSARANLASDSDLVECSTRAHKSAPLPVVCTKPVQLPYLSHST